VFPGASASSPCSAGYPSLALPLVLLLWRDADVAVAVSVALFAASSIATLFAMALPSILQRLRKRPALRLQAPGHRRAGPVVRRHLLRRGDLIAA